MKATLQTTLFRQGVVSRARLLHTFFGEISLDTSWVRELAAIGARAPSADNSQPWTFEWNGQELTVHFAERAHSRGLFRAESHATLLAIGAVIEHLEAALAANGMRGNWQWPVDFSSGKPYASTLLEHSLTKFLAPTGALERHTNRLPYEATRIPDPIMDYLGSYRADGIRVIPLTGAPEKLELAELVRSCSEARFCNKELHEWLITSLRFSPDDVARGDGLDVRSLGLPPGGTHFMRLISDWRRLEALNHFGLYKLLALSEGALLQAAPALLCVVGHADCQGVIEAGRVMARLWMELNVKGIAVHPYYVLTDQINRNRAGSLAAGFKSTVDNAAERISSILALQPTEMLHMVFRIGYPKKKPLRSLRLPMEVIFLDRSSAPKQGLRDKPHA